ncbi:TfoX/Sxy family protein [Zavarzinella formosa]|uniref:TfoX/Sxy family protein n=1 Tax=Zavarzinella formosa TaxID=360055 RepID=UPI001EE67A79|nr:TfoX/Sxy family protein [Zavarzinella formosa]
MAIDNNLVDHVRDRLASLEGVTEKKLFGCARFLLRGNVVAGVWRHRLVVRVGREEYEYTLRDRYANPFDITGKPLRGGCGSSRKGSKATFNWTTGSGGR